MVCSKSFSMAALILTALALISSSCGNDENPQTNPQAHKTTKTKSEDGTRSVPTETPAPAPAPVEPRASAGSNSVLLSYSFSITINGDHCETGKHEFHSLEEYCDALLNDELNNHCALEQRKKAHKRDCK